MHKAKAILFFQNSISSDEGGGVPRVSELIAGELTRRGYKCFFIFYEKDNAQYVSDIKRKVNLTDKAAFNINIIDKFIRENAIDFFVAQQIYEPQFISFYKHVKSKFPNKPLLFFLHANPDFWKVKSHFQLDGLNPQSLINGIKDFLKIIIYPFYNPYINTFSIIFNLADKFMLLSPSYIAQFKLLYNAKSNESKLHFIPNPLTFQNFPSKNDLLHKQKIVLIVSRLEEKQKRISIALKVWKKLPQTIRAEWSLYIVGSGPDEMYYKSYVTKMKIDNVHFYGKRTDVLDFYKKASIFLMTSVWEGLPMALLEAQQNGVVPIAYDNFLSLHDLISDGENGYVIGNNNFNAYLNTLAGLMSNEELRARMGLAAIDGSKKFSINNIAESWEKMFLEVQEEFLLNCKNNQT